MRYLGGLDDNGFQVKLLWDHYGVEHEKNGFYKRPWYSVERLLGARSYEGS